MQSHVVWSVRIKAVDGLLAIVSTLLVSLLNGEEISVRFDLSAEPSERRNRLTIVARPFGGIIHLVIRISLFLGLGYPVVAPIIRMPEKEFYLTLKLRLTFRGIQGLTYNVRMPASLLF